MNEKELPYVTQCSFCENGLLRPALCLECDNVAAICDECELIWIDLQAVYEDPKCKADGAFPLCPNCATESQWNAVSDEELADRDLDQFITDHSL